VKGLPGYPEVLDHFERLSGRPPDARWRALLRPASTSGVTWELFGPYLHMEHQQMDVEGLELLPELNSAETRLVQLALHLYQGCGAVSLGRWPSGSTRSTGRRCWRPCRSTAAG